MQYGTEANTCRMECAQPDALHCIDRVPVSLAALRIE